MNTGKVLQVTEVKCNQPPTPSLAKRKKIQEKSEIRSPTDSMMSPCTRQLIKKATKSMQPSSPLSRNTRDGKENSE